MRDKRMGPSSLLDHAHHATCARVNNYAMVIDDRIVVVLITRHRIDREGVRQGFAHHHGPVRDDRRLARQRRPDDSSDTCANHCADRAPDDRADGRAAKRSADPACRAIVILRQG